MKTSLAYSILFRNASAGKRGLYISLEQSRNNLLTQMAVLGMDHDEVAENLDILDLGLIRKNLRQIGTSGTWMQLFKMYTENLMDNGGYDLIVVDSLDVLEVASGMVDDQRDELFHLFEWFRDLDLTSILIKEADPDRMFDASSHEGYLADAIISLKLVEMSETDIQRRIRVIKMRSTNHHTGHYSLLFNDGIFTATQTISD